MPEIRPFRGYRFASKTTDISTFCSPPYDIQTSEDRRRRQSENPHNVLGLDLAEGSENPDDPGNRYANAKATWDLWREDGTLIQDPTESIYLIEQGFEVGGVHHERTVMVCAVRLHAFDEGIILPHEKTLPKALGDRYRLITATHANFSQVFGLYSDPSDGYTALMADCRSQSPIATAIEDDGTTDRLWRIDDPDLIARFSMMISDRQIFIADGHHRYTTALAYRDACRNAHRSRDGGCGKGREDEDDEGRAPGYDYVMMGLANMDDPQLVVLPYHRAVTAAGVFDPAEFVARLSRDFTIERACGDDLLEEGDGFRFLFDYGEGDMLAVLDPSSDARTRVPAAHGQAWRELDVVLLQSLVLEPFFGITPDDPESLRRISFSSDPESLRESLDTGGCSVVFTMRATRLDQLRAVSLEGETMPQKSTYFYPKLLTGLVMRSLG